jgi:two-component system, NarL family, nitrate/nitrite response regulator NarL
MQIKKILLVDDEPISNLINRKILLNHNPEFEIEDFTNPFEAFNVLESFRPDVIFLDINMPGMTGWDFLEAMRQNNLTNSVIMLTSSTSEAERAKSTTYSNVKNFYVKPLKIGTVSILLNRL